MNLLIESLFVGIYCVFLYFFMLFIFSTKISQTYFLFIFGFLKHFLGYFLGIHKYWCNLHSNYTNNEKNKYWKKIWILIITSLLEGILFVIIGRIVYSFVYFIFKIKWTNYIYFFFLGIFIHFLAELIGIHDYYSKNICKYFI